MQDKIDELIIKECVDLLQEMQIEHTDSGYYGSTEYYERCGAKAEAFAASAKSIKSMFGI